MRLVGGDAVGRRRVLVAPLVLRAESEVPVSPVVNIAQRLTMLKSTPYPTCWTLCDPKVAVNRSEPPGPA